jgi:hypothetical protein
MEDELFNEAIMKVSKMNDIELENELINAGTIVYNIIEITQQIPPPE